MGKPQQKRKPNSQHTTKIPARKHNRIHHLPRSNPRHRKKTQRKILENHNQKIPRLQNQRKRPPNLLVRNPETTNNPTINKIV